MKFFLAALVAVLLFQTPAAQAPSALEAMTPVITELRSKIAVLEAQVKTLTARLETLEKRAAPAKK